MNVRDMILEMRTPDRTPQHIELHNKIEASARMGPSAYLNSLLMQCTTSECIECAVIICPHNEPLHFHHDGCPACD